VGNFLYALSFSVRGPSRMKETVATLGFILFFVGSMMDIAGSTFVTQGGTPAPTYFKVGIIEVLGSLIFIVGIYLIIKTR
jgi:uncharacterized membrane protein YhdT